jgi:hypothetical protein
VSPSASGGTWDPWAIKELVPVRGQAWFLDVDGERYFEPQKVASAFNSFFTTIASSLVNKLPNPFNLFTNSFVSYYRSKGIFGTNFSLSPVSRDFVLKQLVSLNPSKSTGLDSVQSRFLKDGAAILRDPVAHIINMSLLSEVVPRAT